MSGVDLSRDLLVDLGGWDVLKEAGVLVERGCVKEVIWHDKVITGVVESGGRTIRPRLDLAASPFAENRCSCAYGRNGMVCAHAIALCLWEMNARSAVEAASGSDIVIGSELEVAALPKSLVLSEGKGIPLRFCVYLPPNMERLLHGGQVTIRVDAQPGTGAAVAPDKLDRGKAYRLDPRHAAFAALLEEWCGGKLAGMLQMDLDRMIGVFRVLMDEPVFFWMRDPGKAIEWRDHALEGMPPSWFSPASMRSEPLPETEDEKGVQSGHADIQTTKPLGSAAPLSRWEVEGSLHYLSVKLEKPDEPGMTLIRDDLKRSGFGWDPGTGKWWLRDNHKLLNFLADHLDGLIRGKGAVLGPNFSRVFGKVKLARIRADVREVGGRYELEAGLDAGVSDDVLRRQLEQGRKYWVEGDQVVLIPESIIQSLSELSDHTSASNVRSSRIRVKLDPRMLASAERWIDESGAAVTFPDAWKARTSALRDFGRLEDAPMGDSLRAVMRPYQRLGVAWMHHLYRHGLGGLLADEMGLGKTLQAIGLIDAVRKSGSRPALVVSPAGLIGNWAREVRRFCPELKLTVHHGNARGQSADGFEESNVILTSYSTLARDIDWMSGCPFGLVIADEAQHIKNRRTLHAGALRRLSSTGRFLLTGTPIENSIEDAVALFDFVMPGYVAKPAGSGVERERDVGRLKDMLAPYILRRTKEKVAPELPPKIEQVVYCALNEEQARAYESIRSKGERRITEMEAKDEGESRIRMAAFTELLRMRQFCADPRLVDPSFGVLGSAKWEAFREILFAGMDDGHRILVFSQFVSMLSILREELDKLGVGYCYIDGQTVDRLAEADRFNQDPGIPLFLISLKAGGTGLNLTGADTVIHYDPWWNPAVEAQATDRAHRIGQNRIVTSIRLVVADSVEERVQQMQQRKRAFLQELFEASDAESLKVSLRDMKSLFLSADESSG